MASAVASQPLSPGWSLVTLAKRDDRGVLLSRPFEFHQEDVSGDLYGVQDSKKGIDSPNTIRFKSFMMLGLAPLYTVGMMGAALGRVALAIASLCTNTLPQLIKNIPLKGISQTSAHFALQVTVEFPLQLATDVWRIVRSPLYGVGMMAAATVALGCPLEGRKWLGRIEQDWHEGMNYTDDFRYRRTAKEIEDMPFPEVVEEFWSGKIYLLGYCMLKRGNFNDKVAGMPRFEPFVRLQQPKPQPGLFNWPWK